MTHPHLKPRLAPADQEMARDIGQHLRNQGASCGPLNAQGELRLIQAYLRVLGYYGDPRIVTGVSVVTGTMNRHTHHALEAFVAEYGVFHGAPHATPSPAVLDALRQQSRAVTMGPATADPMETNKPLTEAFAQSDTQRKHVLEALHPVMRFPLAAALRELSVKGIKVNILDGYRSPQMQESLIVSGRSTAPPNWSLHNYGLAIDIAPQARTTKEAFDATSDSWKTILRVMEKHGFYSIYQHQKWDLPHFELPIKTADLTVLPTGRDGWKVIPPAAIPEPWQHANRKALNAATTLTASVSLPVRSPAGLQR